AEPALKNRTVTMNGCSKAYAMTGWRIGYAGAPVALIEAMNRLQGQSTANASSISQAAAVEALTGPQDSVEKMRAVYAARREFVVRMLNEAKGLRCHKPEGAFFVFPDVRQCLGRTTGGGKRLEDDGDFVAALLAEEGVVVVPGSAFLAPGHF